MAEALFQSKGMKIELDDGSFIDLGKAQVTGYMGHNFFYDHDFNYPPLTSLARSIPRPRGFFTLGCKTGQVPGFTALLTPNVHAVLMSQTYLVAANPGLLPPMIDRKQSASLANCCTGVPVAAATY